MECLHRFCGECIEKSIRLCKNECPVCREHYPGGCTLGDDRHYDHLISIIHPDIAEYEEAVRQYFKPWIKKCVDLCELTIHVHAYVLVIFKYGCLIIKISMWQSFRRQIKELERKQKARATAVGFARRRRTIRKDINDKNGGKD
ncbi:hypothetical protein LR48_Vigan01g057100 [Vigna angularis]|uniref:Zinc finger C3HC4 RING-type domain-containing protein n=1 Tax=Phaseolus angularis TaxID=3914 RepID=A0A0L9TKL6_PHAAN|nr:hypothetical protein LR48_Vigan01g057100 [Vigna angularis]